MTTMTNPARPANNPAPQRPNLPKGYRWSNVWKVDGQFVEGDPGVELPVNDRWELAGQLWVCPVADCGTNLWTFDDSVAADSAPCCSTHPARLVTSSVNLADGDPVGGANARVKAWARGVYERRRDQAVTAAQVRLDAAKKAVTEATRTTAADMHGHIPSLVASGAVLGGGTWLAVADAPLAAAVGTGVGSFGAVAAYLVAYWVRRLRSTDRADAKRARKDRAFARHIAAGVLGTGVWLLCSAGAAILPLFGQALFTLLLGFLLTFAINRAHWDELWATRRRLKDLLRRQAEAAARRAAEEARRAAEKPAAPPDLGVDESDPLVMGQRMAAEWARISGSPAAATAFSVMGRTWIDPTKTQPVTAPINGELARIGWEYYGQAEPGALVARAGFPAPIVGAKDWLAAVLFDGRHDPATVSLVDRPGGAANRFTLMVTDSVPLGEPVRWQGQAAVKRLPDGTILTHRGRALDGNDYYHPIFVPGQAFGGLDVGTRGGGKSAGTILYLLNCLAAGLFPFLFDPKQLVNYPDFIGIFPIGVTRDHRDAFLGALAAERKRRERHMGRKPLRDEYGREVPGEARWDLNDGPPIAHVWEEFHDLAQDEAWVKELTNHIRFERDVAMGGKFITQGGGLADLSNPMLRSLLNQTELTTYRSDDHQARMAGRKDGTYSASDLPRLPGMCLITAPEAPPIPIRAAYVPRTLNHPDSVFNTLWGRSAEKVLQLPPPVLPQATLEVFRKHGVMEIWERAQGPGGLERLLADAENEEYGGPSPVPADALGGQPVAAMPVQDVVLAIAWKFPGLGPTAITGHALWNRPTAGRKAPDLSNVTRAARTLEEKKGELTRTGGYRVTEKGSAKAQQLYAVLTGEDVKPSEADTEAAGQKAAEA